MWGREEGFIDDKNEASFSVEELEDLCRLDIYAGWQTHELLGCGCEGVSVVPGRPSKEVEPETALSKHNNSKDKYGLPFHPGSFFVQGTETNIAPLQQRVQEAQEKHQEGAIM